MCLFKGLPNSWKRLISGQNFSRSKDFKFRKLNEQDERDNINFFSKDISKFRDEILLRWVDCNTPNFSTFLFVLERMSFVHPENFRRCYFCQREKFYDMDQNKFSFGPNWSPICYEPKALFLFFIIEPNCVTASQMRSISQHHVLPPQISVTEKRGNNITISTKSQQKRFSLYVYQFHVHHFQ